MCLTRLAFIKVFYQIYFVAFVKFLDKSKKDYLELSQYVCVMSRNELTIVLGSLTCVESP